MKSKISSIFFGLALVIFARELPNAEGILVVVYPCVAFLAIEGLLINFDVLGLIKRLRS